MVSESLKSDIRAVVEPVVVQNGFVLFELNLKIANKTVTVEALVDKENGGITLDECIEVNRQLNERIEEAALIDDDYFIEVSSPGLDQRLKNPKDFRRVCGRKVRFHLNEKIEGKCEHLGVVRDVNDQSVTIENKKNTVSIPIAIIQKAIQEI